MDKLTRVLGLQLAAPLTNLKTIAFRVFCFSFLSKCDSTIGLHFTLYRHIFLVGRVAATLCQAALGAATLEIIALQPASGASVR